MMLRRIFWHPATPLAIIFACVYIVWSSWAYKSRHERILSIKDRRDIMSEVREFQVRTGKWPLSREDLNGELRTGIQKKAWSLRRLSVQSLVDVGDLSGRKSGRPPVAFEIDAPEQSPVQYVLGDEGYFLRKKILP